MADEDDLRTLPVWKPQQLTGSRAGTWALRVKKTGESRFEGNGLAMQPRQEEI